MFKVKLSVEPLQIGELLVSVISVGLGAITVKLVVEVQPEPEYVIVTVPAELNVTTPVDASIDAIVELLLVQLPVPATSARVIDVPTQPYSPIVPYGLMMSHWAMPEKLTIKESANNHNVFFICYILYFERCITQPCHLHR